MTSWDNRIVVDTFGRASGERPRRTGTLANFSGQPSVDRSGAVSGSRPRSVEASLSFIGSPRAGDPACVAAGRPAEHRRHDIQKADGDVVNLPAVSPVARDSQCLTSERAAAHPAAMKSRVGRAQSPAAPLWSGEPMVAHSIVNCAARQLSAVAVRCCLGAVSPGLARRDASGPTASVFAHFQMPTQSACGRRRRDGTAGEVANSTLRCTYRGRKNCKYK